MASIRIGIASEFNLVDSKVGVGTTNPTELMDVRGQIYSDNSIGAGGISTVTTYQGFLDTKQTIKSSVSEGTVVAGSLSEEIVIEGEVTVSSGTTYRSGVDHLTVTDNFTLPGISDDVPTVGTTRFNEDLGALEFYTGVEWRAVNSYVDNGNMGRAIWAGGYDTGGVPTSTTSSIDYIHIPTLGNSTKFGELSASGQDAHGSGSKTRGLFSGKFNNAQIDYITIASLGDGLDFGDLTAARNYGASGSSSTRGLHLGGNTPSTVNTIDYVEIQTLGNAIDFGDLSKVRKTYGGAISDGRHILAGGTGPGAKDATYDRKSINSSATAVEFGNLIAGVGYGPAGAGNQTRGIWAGGSEAPGYSKSIQYVIIASGGNTQYFGDLSIPSLTSGGGETSIRAVFAIGMTPSGDVNTLEYVTITSSGNAQDFGDLRGGNNEAHSRVISPVSDSHGGLGGF